MILETALLFVIVLYLLQAGVFLYGIAHARDQRQNTTQPFVSVVVAARNEEETLSECLDSLLRQRYPRNRYEIIIINDGSTDRTEEVCKRYVAEHGNVKAHLAEPSERLRGKPNALHQGIMRAAGEVIMITDADCTVPETWIEETVRRYSPSVGIVGGITLQRALNRFEGMQSLDWAFLLGIACAGVSLRNPLSTIGNNLSFRKEAYLSVGGYPKIPFSVTEDFVLFQSIVKTKRWVYLYPIDAKLLVVSRPCSTVRELIRQKQRWGRGGLDMKPSGMAIMGIGFAAHALILLTFFTGGVFAGGSALLAKMIADYFFLHDVLRRLQRTDLLRYFYWFELYFFLYVLILPFVVFFGGKVVWKGRTY